MAKIEVGFIRRDDNEQTFDGKTLQEAFDKVTAATPVGMAPDWNNAHVDDEAVRGICENCGLPISDESFKCDDDGVIWHTRDCSDYGAPE